VPQPAPARFDLSARNALATSLLAATGPALTLTVLLAGYALSARVCATGIRWWMAGCIALAVCGTLASALRLARRVESSQPQSTRTLRPAMIGLQVFCVLVMAAFGIALTTVVRCD
jgi:hypothetical protein